MPPTASPPGLGPAREALAQLATGPALEHLHATRDKLAELTASLSLGPPPALADRLALETALRRFQADLRAASSLAAQGLALCHDWADQLQPPPTYQPTGAFTATRPRNELSLEA